MIKSASFRLPEINNVIEVNITSLIYSLLQYRSTDLNLSMPVLLIRANSRAPVTNNSIVKYAIELLLDTSVLFVYLNHEEISPVINNIAKYRKVKVAIREMAFLISKTPCLH